MTGNHHYNAKRLLIDIALRKAYAATGHRKKDRAYTFINDAEYIVGQISRPGNVSPEEHDRIIETISEEISDVRTKIKAEFEPAGESR